MDVDWFKEQQKKLGISGKDIANLAGRSEGALSHIYSGRQVINNHWAQAFSKAFGIPIATILEKGGALPASEARQLAPGFSDGDVVRWEAGANRETTFTDQAKAALVGDRSGVDAFLVKSEAMALDGYLPGDLVLVDSRLRERTGTGDVVIAQVYDNSVGTAKTVLRRFQPPVIVASGVGVEGREVHVVDNTNCVIMGKVIASWRLNL